jgi:hypothetical protein
MSINHENFQGKDEIRMNIPWTNAINPFGGSKLERFILSNILAQEKNEFG